MHQFGEARESLPGAEQRQSLGGAPVHLGNPATLAGEGNLHGHFPMRPAHPTGIPLHRPVTPVYRIGVRLPRRLSKATGGLSLDRFTPLPLLKRGRDGVSNPRLLGANMECAGVMERCSLPLPATMLPLFGFFAAVSNGWPFSRTALSPRYPSAALSRHHGPNVTGGGGDYRPRGSLHPLPI
jgi:hypothetical protein